MCALKVRIYQVETDSMRYTVAFQRRSGCAFVFHSVYKRANGFVRAALAKEIKDATLVLSERLPKSPFGSNKTASTAIPNSPRAPLSTESTPRPSRETSIEPMIKDEDEAPAPLQALPPMVKSLERRRSKES